MNWMGNKVKLTKNIITRKDALKLAPHYVAFVDGDHDKFEAIEKKFSKVRVGQKVLTCSDGTFVMAKVSSIDKNDPRAVDGPVVRVTNGEFSWRVDGNEYAVPVIGKAI